MDFSYLDLPTFAEPHDGPLVDATHPHHGFDPSPEQIRRRTLAIRKAVPREPVGSTRERVELQVVPAAAVFGDHGHGA